jgi:hypothetical protein
MNTGITTVIYLSSRTHLFDPFEVGEVGSDGCDFRDPPGFCLGMFSRDRR